MQYSALSAGVLSFYVIKLDLVSRPNNLKGTALSLWLDMVILIISEQLIAAFAAICLDRKVCVTLLSHGGGWIRRNGLPLFLSFIIGPQNIDDYFFHCIEMIMQIINHIVQTDRY